MTYHQLPPPTLASELLSDPARGLRKVSYRSRFRPLRPRVCGLFGFERTAAISTQSAEAIAKVAQAFGQEDDITVLTLTFAPIEVAHA